MFCTKFKFGKIRRAKSTYTRRITRKLLLSSFFPFSLPLVKLTPNSIQPSVPFPSFQNKRKKKGGGGGKKRRRRNAEDHIQTEKAANLRFENDHVHPASSVEARKSNRISQWDFYYLVINFCWSVDGPEIIRNVASPLFSSSSLASLSRRPLGDAHLWDQSQTELVVWPRPRAKLLHYYDRPLLPPALPFGIGDKQLGRSFPNV